MPDVSSLVASVDRSHPKPFTSVFSVLGRAAGDNQSFDG